ncbi:MAG: hypothetical protein WCF19_01880 [Chlamydiales bacterium]
MKQIIALFGEAEKGAFKVPHLLGKLPQLVDLLGNPPAESQGLYFAVQAILYNREILFFRVAEEGFSQIDYFQGLKFLENREKVKSVHAICLPGVGDPEILALTEGVCHIHKSLLITNQKDLYDFLTSQ